MRLNIFHILYAAAKRGGYLRKGTFFVSFFFQNLIHNVHAVINETLRFNKNKSLKTTLIHHSCYENHRYKLNQYTSLHENFAA